MSKEVVVADDTSSVIAQSLSSTMLDPARSFASSATGFPPLSHLFEAELGAATTAARSRPALLTSRDSAYRRILAMADTLGALTAIVFCRAISGPQHPGELAVFIAPLAVVMGKVMGLYDREEWLVRKSTLDEAPGLFQLATLYAIAVWLIDGTFISHFSERRVLLVIWVSVFFGLLLFRSLGRWLCRRVTRAERCMVIGDARICERVRVKLGRTASLHAQVVAQVVLSGTDNAENAIVELSDREDLKALADAYHVERIIVAPERADAEEVLNLIRVATAIGVKVSVVPRVLEVIGSSAEFDDLEGVPLLSMRRVKLSRSSYCVKRGMDILGSSAALLLLAPVLAVIAMLIKLDSAGTALYRQRRIGKDGESFEIFKFRTMVPGAEAQRGQLLHLNEADGLFKIENDPRITRVGAWLRRLSLDELPQFLNVARGEMSLVGPRPLIVEEDRRIEGWHRWRLQLTPGMTGHWQILGSARIPLDEMVKIDYLYVTNWSLWLDVKILLRTVAYVVARKGM